MSDNVKKSEANETGTATENETYVDTDRLVQHGQYLMGSKESLDILLDSLNTKMGTVTNGWKDVDGELFKSEFSEFISEAKKINNEIESLGKFAVNNASRYETVLSESIAMMGE